MLSALDRGSRIAACTAMAAVLAIIGADLFGRPFTRAEARPMHATIRIDMGNDAFGVTAHDRGAELAAALRTLADQLEESGASAGDRLGIMDSNGNSIGAASVTEDSDDG